QPGDPEETIAVGYRFGIAPFAQRQTPRRHELHPHALRRLPRVRPPYFADVGPVRSHASSENVDGPAVGGLQRKLGNQVGLSPLEPNLHLRVQDPGLEWLGGEPEPPLEVRFGHERIGVYLDPAYAA